MAEMTGLWMRLRLYSSPYVTLCNVIIHYSLVNSAPQWMLQTWQGNQVHRPHILLNLSFICSYIMFFCTLWEDILFKAFLLCLLCFGICCLLLAFDSRHHLRSTKTRPCFMQYWSKHFLFILLVSPLAKHKQIATGVRNATCNVYEKNMHLFWRGALFPIYKRELVSTNCCLVGTLYSQDTPSPGL